MQVVQLSVIIPVYNVERTLARCVNSVLSQNCAGCEVILVDDGSPDASGLLCDELASANPCIKVLHKENGGLSDARNSGLDAASGEYVTFVDSDDFIAGGTYGLLMDIIARHPEYDILEYPIFVHYGSPGGHVLDTGNHVYRSPSEYWLAGMAYNHSYACNKIFRKSLFDRVRFPSGKVFEDMHTLPLLLGEARTVATADAGMYYYCWNDCGITATASGGALSSLLSAHVGVVEKLSRSQGGTCGFLKYYMHVLNIECDVCRLTGRRMALPRVCFPFVKSLVYLFKSCGVKFALKFAAYYFFGIGGLCMLDGALRSLSPGRGRRRVLA